MSLRHRKENYLSVLPYMVCGILLVLFPTIVYPQNKPLPDFAIDADSITFSNDSPMEGEEVIVKVMVKNIGDVTPTMNETLEVWIYEGNPDENALQMKVDSVIISLEPGKSKPISADWRFRTGTHHVHAVVNPKDSELFIEEKSLANNIASKPITVKNRTFPKATKEQIDAAVKKGLDWLREQQGRHIRKCPQDETENPPLLAKCMICQASLTGLPIIKTPKEYWDWGEGPIQATSIAVFTLLSGGVPVSDKAVQEGLTYLLNADWNNFQDAYDFSVVIPTLVATGDKEKYFDRVQFAVDRLISKQLLIEKNANSDIDDGGWGYGTVADGAHLQYAIYALYAAKQWGIEIPQKVWDRAVGWVRRNQDGKGGGWYYNLVESLWAEGVYGSMTATGIMTLKAAGVPLSDKQMQKGFEWLEKYYTITSNPGAFSWQYYFLLALERAFDVSPRQEQFAGHNWYEEIANMMVAEQQPDGRWVDIEDYFPTTCFAILFLTRAVPKPIAPDLGIIKDGIRFSPPSPREGEPITITTTVINTGAELDGMVDVAFYDGNPQRGGERIDSQKVIFSPSRPDATASITWKASGAKRHSIYVHIDPANKISELSEKNNIAMMEITIRPESAAPVSEESNDIKKIKDGVYQIGNLILDVNKNEITVPGRIRKTQGIIEYLATGELGKTHESVLVLDVEPIHLQVALLRLGMEFGSNLRYQGDPLPPKGDPAEIWVEWEVSKLRDGEAPAELGVDQTGKRILHRAEDLVYDIMKGAPMEHTNWIFTGSRIIDNRIFAAQATQSIIAIYRDADAIFNNPLPGGADDNTYRVNSEVVPSENTKIKLIIKMVKKVG
ncbi:hypothetical protein H8E77_09140 [bacterium]|nr:hypothetical protein [bacterium]